MSGWKEEEKMRLESQAVANWKGPCSLEEPPEGYEQGKDMVIILTK